MNTEIITQAAQQVLPPVALFALVLATCWVVDRWFCGGARRHGL